MAGSGGLIKHPMAEEVRKAYEAGEDMEALEPRVLVDTQGTPVGRIGNGDYVIFYNLRGEREVELSRSLIEEDFPHFPVGRLNLKLATMIPYQKGLKARVAYPVEEEIRESLSELLSRAGLRQAKISEAEKAIHVSYFMNGKSPEPFPGEERIVVPTFKDVAFFDQKPEMNAAGVADAVLEKIADPQIAFTFANFANIDVVGHIENAAAIRKAAEAVDYQIGRCLEGARRAGVISIVTADHGTAEKWLYPDGSIDTGHTDSPVPFILIDPRKEGPSIRLRAGGELADIAPTILQILGIPQPGRMTGQSLFFSPPGTSPEKKRVLLLLLDGWGYREEKEGNILAQARTPVMDDLRAHEPFVSLRASGDAVGLSAGTVGNSEVGHMHIGCGRRVLSDLSRIDRAIEDGSFFRNEAFLWAMAGARKDGKNLHLLGIVSFFSSHGSVNHFLALLRMARKEGVEKVYHHAMLSRRGEHKESAAQYLEMIEKEMERLSLGRLVSAIGRYWSLDREENWDRVEKTYRMLVYGEGIPVADET